MLSVRGIEIFFNMWNYFYLCTMWKSFCCHNVEKTQSFHNVESAMYKVKSLLGYMVRMGVADMFVFAVRVFWIFFSGKGFVQQEGRKTYNTNDIFLTHFHSTLLWRGISLASKNSCCKTQPALLRQKLLNLAINFLNWCYFQVIYIVHCISLIFELIYLST